MAIDIDTTQPLRRPLELQRLVDAVVAAGSADEAFWIECKNNDFDLTKAEGRFNLGRAILSFVNRIPDTRPRSIHCAPSARSLASYSKLSTPTVNDGGAMSSKVTLSTSQPRPKQLIICLDGTNDEIGRGIPTNVGKTYELLKLSEAGQAAYYDPGIGTLPAVTARGFAERKVSVGLELMFGRGIRSKLASAYTWLMQNYDHGSSEAGMPRSRVYVFGFSRGAFTARALVGMLNRVGLLRPGAENLVPYAVAHYTVNQARFTPERLAQTRRFANAFCWGTEQDPLSEPWREVSNDQDWHAMPIEFMGLWDTVEAVGLPGRTVDWEGTHTLRNAKRIRHAVSIDEWRRPFREFLTTHPDLNPLSYEGTPDVAAAVQEVWFPGVHCDVGGTYPDSQLSTAAFRWVLEAVIDEFIPREPSSFQLACQAIPAPGSAPLHTDGALWSLTVPRMRPIKPRSWISDSVRTLLEDRSIDYQPRNLPADPVWLTTPPPAVTAPELNR